jgi:dTDP-4-dehydrorhamnose reductase
MKILLLGKNGQVGWELQRSLAPLGEVVACDFDSPPDTRADFSDPASLVPLIQRVQPHLIVNSAAHTAVDKAESEPELARTLNAVAPGLIARQAAELGALLVHYSTDYVFDGGGTHARTEDEPTAPLSVYGRTKLEGEQLIRSSGCQHLILRTSWVYAARGGNFARTMLRLAAEREELRVIADQIGAPTGAELLADVTALAVQALRSNPTLSGTYHCAAAGETNWHAYAQLVIEWARQRGHPVKVAPDRVLAISTDQYPTPAKRPLNSRLDTARLQRSLGLSMPHWKVGVERMLTEVLG